jgi:pentatricopeptide repeat protein
MFMPINLNAVWNQLYEGLLATQTEIMIFMIAFATHAIIFGRHRIPKGKAETGEKSMKTPLAEPSKNTNRKTQDNYPNMASYTGLLKASLQEGSFKQARKVLADMVQDGLQPNCTMFNELVDLGLKNSSRDAWGVVEDMQRCGAKPNRITCSILLKSLQRNSSKAEISRVLEILDDIEGEVDDVLVNSFIEACLRVGPCEQLGLHLQKLRSSKKLRLKSHSYASLIRASGNFGDVDGIWQTWREMRRHHVAPTSITLGCMVEALTTNSEVDASYELLQELLTDDVYRPLVNSVVFGSVMKGFSHQKRFDRVWVVYQEMQHHNIALTIVTYNTLLDACARSGMMAQIPGLVETMTTQGIEPNLITYGIVIKGYCQENKLDDALQVWESMVQGTNLQPDEIMYNTILDGCARKGLHDRGMQLFGQMESAGIRPSNFTLSVLIKLCTKSNLLENAFQIVKDITERYRFRPNIHVYNNLILACTAHKELSRALDVFDQMARERVHPDDRTYTLLLRACISVGDGTAAAGLIRGAMGMKDPHPRLSKVAYFVKLQKGLSSELIGEFVEQIAGTCRENQVALALIKDLRDSTRVKLPAQLQLRLAKESQK